MIATKLTGRTRHRVHTRWLKPPLIVVQVEFYKKGTAPLWNSHYAYSEEVDYFVWKDATLEDLSMMKAREA